MGDWDEPDFDALCDALKDLHKNHKRHRQQAEVHAGETSAFNWNTAADQLLQVVKPTGNRVSGKWKALEPECEIEVIKRVQADIGGHRVELTPGKKHRVVLNVRDVLKAAGLLV